MSPTALATTSAISDAPYVFASPDAPSQSDRRQELLQPAEISGRLKRGKELLGRQATEARSVEVPSRHTIDDEVKVINLPKFAPLPGRAQESFGALQEWEGVITEVRDNVILANLIDITRNGTTFDETAEIPIEEVSDDDRAHVVRGAIFRWVIGYARKPSGTKMRGSIIYFRRTVGASPKASEPFTLG